jgi:RibD C-terminal domain
MAKVLLYMSMSDDGFITGPDDGMDHGLGVNGERLHDWLRANPASRRPRLRPGGRDILLHGAAVAQACLRAGLLDEMQLQRMPVLLGQGRRLFEAARPHRARTAPRPGRARCATPALPRAVERGEVMALLAW